MPSRRAVLGATVAALAPGCLGGDAPVRAAGSPARFDAPDEYERVRATNRTLNATVTVTLQGDVEGRESADVVATVPVWTYRRNGTPPRVVAVASSPYVRVIENPPSGGDPLSTLSTAGVVEFVQDAYGQVTAVRERDARTVTTLERESTVRTYRATARRDGSDVPLTLHVARVRDGGDVVTVVVVHPAAADGDPSAVLERVAHPR